MLTVYAVHILAILNGWVYCTLTVNKNEHIVNKRNMFCTYCQHKEHLVYILSTFYVYTKKV